MTCEGCGRDVTLMDGHYCGQCTGQIAANIQGAINDLAILDGTVKDVYTGDDGHLHARITTGVTPSGA